MFAAAALSVPTLSAVAGDPNIAPFTEEAAIRGIEFTPAPSTAYGVYAFGVSFADIDGDGDPDLTACGDPSGIPGIWENDGTGHFVDRSAGSGITSVAKASSIAYGDYDGDGDLDLYLTAVFTPPGSTSRLYRNEGNFQFTNVTAQSGTANVGTAKAASWADYDADGDLDLFVAVYRNATPQTANVPNSLYRNNGDGTFTDVAATQGLAKPAYCFTGAWVDYDLDGDVDLYTSNDRGSLPPFFQGNQLFRNDGGQLVETVGTGASVQLFSMGLAVGDLDSNGHPDFYCTNLPSANQPLAGRNPLLLNQGDGTFLLADRIWGVSAYQTTWGCFFFDFDNDGPVDLYVQHQFVANRLFRNLGQPPMQSLTVAAGASGLPGPSYAGAVADIDADGDLDMVVSNLGSPLFLYINHEGEERNWVRFRMVGSGPNRHAIGGWAHLTTTLGGSTAFRDLAAGGRGYLGQDELILHHGLGAEVGLAKADFHWPRGPSGAPVRTLVNVPANQLWTVYPPERLGDVDGDLLITAVDRDANAGCAAAGFVTGCEMMDFDGDSDIDSADLAAFEVRACDLDSDGAVGAPDLTMLLSNWGTSGPAGDIDANGVVSGSDLALLLAAWQ
jgi:hypothetical protein